MLALLGAAGTASAESLLDPAVANWGTSRVDLAVRNSDGTISVRTFANSTWGNDWVNIGGLATSPPAVAELDGYPHIFVRGNDGAVYHKWAGPGGAWSNWENLGGYIYGKPAVSYTGTQIRLFGRGNDNGVWQKYWTPASGWVDWSRVPGGVATSSPASVMTNWGRIDVFVRGNDGAVYQNLWTSWDGWMGWGSLGGFTHGAPAVASYDNSNYQVYASGGNDDKLYVRMYANGWGNWTDLGGTMAPQSGAAAFSWAVAHSDAYVRGADGAIYHRSYQGGTWGNWQSLGFPNIQSYPTSRQYGAAPDYSVDTPEELNAVIQAALGMTSTSQVTALYNGLIPADRDRFDAAMSNIQISSAQTSAGSIEDLTSADRTALGSDPADDAAAATAAAAGVKKRGCREFRDESQFYIPIGLGGVIQKVVATFEMKGRYCYDQFKHTVYQARAPKITEPVNVPTWAAVMGYHVSVYTPYSPQLTNCILPCTTWYTSAYGYRAVAMAIPWDLFLGWKASNIPTNRMVDVVFGLESNQAVQHMFKRPTSGAGVWHPTASDGGVLMPEPQG